jgi:hypothetical protein
MYGYESVGFLNSLKAVRAAFVPALERAVTKAAQRRLKGGAKALHTFLYQTVKSRKGSVNLQGNIYW